jgi:hypothetical protein
MLHSSGCIINVDWIDGNAFRPISDELWKQNGMDERVGFNLFGWLN